jgi:tRNA threonylcarbamoyladenosine biosynthesis protein TsaB
MQLVIETATAACSVALIDGGKVIAAFHEIVGRGHAERLIPMIAELPGGGRASEIIASCGPGSFTGVRVGLAAARGLALAWNIPAHGYPTLAAIAARQFADNPELNEILIATEGGHGQLFVQSFKANGIAATSALLSMTPDAAAAQFGQEAVAGTAAEKFVAARGFGTAALAGLSAADFALLGAGYAACPLIPLYGRGADAKPMAA